MRLGDGLEVIKHNEQLDNITICGMGGPLIAKNIKRRTTKTSIKILDLSSRVIYKHKI